MLVLSRLEGQAVWLNDKCLRITRAGNGVVDLNFDGKRLELDIYEWLVLMPGVSMSANRIHPSVRLAFRAPNNIRIVREELLTKG